ncbi:polymer-forming cytoskeletal protein [Brevibacillus centrosporus]|uniref:polymer-forming cytoskeletal protein n=1 Tax=Brevibacillus centrosporus TaxID=54910 RepID=UPI000F0A40A7|nr:polymer-forming cytoskeletal protein [Brevibacillus centrosporus]MEC2130402.1 polymer-forming cytoskeletal protein [Brevibacillus centrosporus]RNB68991.1 cell shape determination protein CcmA [Brevibacillus centrosporus]GED32655.1 hypothetical protein BCE02nite_37960 [Brevibacillus centrosporus]
MMNQDNRPDLVIHGTVNAAGGVYGEVAVHGFGKIKGNVECLDLHCAGHVNVDGDVHASRGKIEGNANICGAAHFENMEVYGQLDVNGDMTFTQLRVDGSVKVHGSVSGEEILLNGFLKATGDCEAEVFKAKGAFTIGGLLNAGHVSIHLHGSSEAREIGGEHIEVRKAGISTLNKLMKQFFNNTLSVDTVEGDEIYLEYTRAKIVRGTNIEIGPGCEIDLVEYSGEFRQDSSSRVKEHTKRGEA